MVDVGFVGGMPLTTAFATGKQQPHFCYDEEATSATRRYTVGPELRLAWPHDFGIEIDALYKRLGYDSVFDVGCDSVYTRSIQNSWEFPVLVTHPLPRRLPGALYLTGGPSFRIANDVSLTAYATYPGGYMVIPNPRNSTALIDHRSQMGIAAGLGGESRLGRLRIRPELRYTRWRADSPQSNTLHSNQNQLELLVGFGVAVHDRVP